MRYTIAAALLLLAADTAQAQIQTYTTTPDGFGGSWTVGPNGYSATTMPDGFGGSFTTVQPGGGYLPTVPFPERPMQLPQPRPLVAPQGYYR